VADPGCLFRIRDSNFYIPDPGSKRFRIRIKEHKYFKPKKLSPSSRKYRSSRIRIFFPSWISDTDTGSRGKKASDPGSGSTTPEVTVLKHEPNLMLGITYLTILVDAHLVHNLIFSLNLTDPKEFKFTIGTVLP
jgi:hypothetical protein